MTVAIDAQKPISDSKGTIGPLFSARAFQAKGRPPITAASPNGIPPVRNSKVMVSAPNSAAEISAVRRPIPPTVPAIARNSR